MSTSHVLESQQSAPHAQPGRMAAAGCWKLAPGRALSLQPRQHGVLEIAQGRVWVTLSGSTPAAAAECPVDHVLEAGGRLAVAAGQHLVMEAWCHPGAPAGGVAFDWTVQAALADALAPSRGAQWERTVVQPLRELGQALGQGAGALGRAGSQAAGAAGRLVLGLGRFALFCIATPQGSRTA